MDPSLPDRSGGGDRPHLCYSDFELLKLLSRDLFSDVCWASCCSGLIAQNTLDSMNIRILRYIGQIALDELMYLRNVKSKHEFETKSCKIIGCVRRFEVALVQVALNLTSGRTVALIKTW